MTRKPVAILLVLSLAVLALAIVPAAGLAAKGGAAGKPGGGGGGNGGGGKPGGGGGTLSLVLLESTDGVPHYGQRVTFDVDTTATNYPWVSVDCSQAGRLVYEQSNGIFATSLSTTFTLGPTPSWTGGEADCTATLENWDRYPRITPLASMTFHVNA